AREGEQFNAAQAAGTLSTGERVATATARAAVRVRRGVFSSQQVVLGRVFEDANGNGLFDKDEKGLADVRIYLNNGQSVVTDSAGLYNFPVVNEGAQVLSLDPVTLPYGYAPAATGRRDEQTWTRLLRTPLGGGALLRQNFALRADDDMASAGGHVAAPAAAPSNRLSAPATPQTAGLAGSLFGGGAQAEAKAETSEASEASEVSETKGTSGAAAPKAPGPSAAGTYELVTTETLEPVAPGAVRVVSPRAEETVLGASLEISAQVNGAWSVSVEVEGRKVPDSKVGERRLDRKNDIATFNFVGVNVAPGPNRIRVTAVGPEGQEGRSVELVAYGRGPAKRLEIVTDKPELSAGGRDRTTVRVRAFDQWNRPAADGSVALEVSEGRLLRLEEKGGGARAGEGVPADDRDGRADNADPERQDAAQQTVPLVGGEGRAVFVAGGAPGQTEIRATTGTVETKRAVRVTPEVRPAILVGLAEVTVGAGGPELTAESDAMVRSRLAFFYRGQFLASNLLTLSYDSNRPINRAGGRDRLFLFDPLDRAYPLFGDSSTRSEDAQSNSKLYLRVDRGRSYFLFGDFDTDNKEAGLASYTRRLTGAKLHLENAGGDYVSVTGARPDTAFARDVFPGGGGFARLSHPEILPGSETVMIEVRDRRNPEVILTREALVRGVDYNLDAATGEIFFLRPVSTFDFSFNLVQTVVTYEYRADAMSSAVYTARAFKTFEGAGLKLGLSYVDQRQGEFGAFRVAGVDAEKTLPNRGRLRAEWAMSRGRAAVGGNLFDSAAGDDRHDGSAMRLQLEQPLPWRDAMLRAGFLRVGEGFLNPFGETVTPGSQRADASVELKARAASRVRLGFSDERNHTENVDNSRQTASLLWTEQFGERLRATFGYDFRSFNDHLEGTETVSNLVSVGAEWQATGKLQLTAKREQNLSPESDPTYPDQTTLGATYQWDKHTRLFFTQRFSSAPITPISDPLGGGFFSTGARQETAVGVETRLGRVGNFVSRYQLENGLNGSDSFAVVGLSNRLSLTKRLGLDFGYERGFHVAGEGESFNAGHLGFTWQPAEDFRTTARYEARDRGGMGSVLTFGAQGRLLDNLTSLARFQLSRTSFDGRDGSALSMTAAVAWRPLESDRAGLLFSYTRRDLSQEGAAGAGQTRDRSDTLSSDWYYQATRRLELYGRFALRFGDTGTQELARVSNLTYMAQGRAAYRLGRYFDVAGEARWLAQPSSATHRTSAGAELGYWLLSDLRLGGGYNWVGVGEPFGGQLSPGRRGFYFTISSKLSNLFDLFGTPRHNARPAEGEEGRAATKREE
ncbi:MAG TPA: SdrD B-like domain-containing protein, partial [Pyrinomonadaceae bacterium]|nr:SdrD B-like domain-containing protein [Pyrinomonadaceae bacterium]